MIGISSLTNSNFLFIYKYNLNVEPTLAQFFVSIACFPICLKPLYGIFLDFMNYKGRKKQEIFLWFCFGEAMINVLAAIINPETLICNFIFNIFLCFFFYAKLVIIDAYLVVLIRKFNRGIPIANERQKNAQRLIVFKLFGYGVGVLISNCSSYLLATFSPQQIYILSMILSFFTFLFSWSFFKILEYKKQSKKIKSYKKKTEFINEQSKENKMISLTLTPVKFNIDSSPFYSNNHSDIKDNMTRGVSQFLGETKEIEDNYTEKLQTDLKDIWKLTQNKQLRILLLVVTLENLTPEISCIFFYYFIEILQFSYFDVSSVFVFASLGFLLSLIILNIEFMNSSFESFYKLTSFLIVIAYFMNLR